MNQARALPTVLELLDDGLRLYRRNLAGFTLVATAVLVVVALFSLSFMAFVRTEIGTTAGWTFLAFCVLLAVGYPLMLYAFAALSRATAAALDGRPITLPGALRLSPARGCGMLVFNALFSVIAAATAGFLAFALACPMTYVSLLSAGLISTLSGGASAAAFGFFGLIGQLSTLWTCSIFGAWLASLIYAVQVFVLEQLPWSQSVGRAVDLLAARFGQSLLMFLGAGAIFATLMISYLGSLLVLIAFVQDRLSLNLPPLVGDVIVIVLVVASLVILLPPLAIWMAMFYRHVALERDGATLTRHISAWRTTLVEER